MVTASRSRVGRQRLTPSATDGALDVHASRTEVAQSTVVAIPPPGWIHEETYDGWRILAYAIAAARGVDGGHAYPKTVTAQLEEGLSPAPIGRRTTECAAGTRCAHYWPV